MVDFAFPQDGDYDDAANFATYGRRKNTTAYVDSGLSITADFVNNAVDISAGKVFVPASSDTAVQTGETRTDVDYVLEMDARTGLALTDAAINYVYVYFDTASDDILGYDINTTDTPPADPSLKIAEIDTTADTVTLLNRAPDGAFASIEFGEEAQQKLSHDQTNNRLVLHSNATAADYAYFNDDGTVEFLNGVDVGGLEAPDDSYVTLVDQPISAITAGTKVGYTFAIDAIDFLSIEAQADGAGSIQSAQVLAKAQLDMGTNDLVAGATTIWDSTNGYVPSTSVQDVWVNAGGDTMSGNLQVNANLGVGVSPTSLLHVKGPDDAAGTITFEKGADTATAGTPSLAVNINGSLDVTGDVTDGATTIWDSVNNHVPSAVVQQAGLDADTLDALDSTSFLRSDADDTWKSANLTFEGPDDAAGTITFQAGADTATTGAPSIAVNVGGALDVTGNITAGATTIWDSANGWVPSSVVQKAGLDADTLDALDSTSFLRSDANDTWKSSALTIEGPDDAAGSVTIQPGADTATAGTPSMAVSVTGTLDASGEVGAAGGLAVTGNATSSFNADSNILVEDGLPQIELHETGLAAGSYGTRYWLHQNGGNFYLLVDRADDGTWDSPHPFKVAAASDRVELMGSTLVGSNYVRFPTVTADPTSPPVGGMWYRSDLD